MNGKEKSKISSGRLNGEIKGLRKVLASFICRKAELDAESLRIIREYSEKGSIVIASFQSSSISLLMLYNLLLKNKVSLPRLALEFNPVLLQTLGYIVKRVLWRFKNLFKDDKAYEFDRDLIKEELSSSNPMIFSMLSDHYFLRRYMEKKYDTLYYLIEIQREYDRPIYIVPQTIFWSRKPETASTNGKSNGGVRAASDKSSLSALCSSTTPSYVHMVEPLDLKEFIDSHNDKSSGEISNLVRDRLIALEQEEERIVLGPVIAPRQEMMERVLYHPNVRAEIDELHKREKTSKSRLRKKAYKYYKEIAADFSIAYIHFFQLILNYIFRKLFRGMSVGEHLFGRIKEAARKGPVILVPCHRSHMDYLILSYLFYKNRIIPPHIAAGVNLSFFPMGTIFRHCGAFFLRRTFKGLKLYPTVFRQYFKTLVHDNYQIEFFIEGGRTRTGRLLKAKPGLLKFAIEAVEEKYAEDVTFVPISINYDRILEEGSYFRESRGNEKKNENVSAILSGRKFLKKDYGQVYIEAGEPFSLKDIQAQGCNEEELVPVIGKRIMIEIGKAVMVTPVSFVTTAMLMQLKKGFSMDQLVATAELLHRYLLSINVPLSEAVSKGDVKEIVHDIALKLKRDNLIEEITDEDIQAELLVIKDESRQLISIYKNSIQHYFLPLFVTANIVRRNQSALTDMELLMKEYELIYNYISYEFVLPVFDREATLEEVDTLMQGFVAKEKLFASDDSLIKHISRQLAFGVQDILEGCYAVFSTLENMKQKKLPSKTMYNKIRETAVAMNFNEKIKMVESVSVPVFKNICGFLKDEKAIVEEGEKKKASIKIVDRNIIASHRKEIQTFLAIK